MSRAQYIEECKQKVQEFFKTHRYRIMYLRNKHGQPKGLVLMYLDESERVKLGYSLCHTKKTEYLLDTATGQISTVTKKYDTYNRYIGICKAIENASYVNGVYYKLNVPPSLLELAKHMLTEEDRLLRAKVKV